MILGSLLGALLGLAFCYGVVRPVVRWAVFTWDPPGDFLSGGELLYFCLMLNAYLLAGLVGLRMGMLVTRKKLKNHERTGVVQLPFAKE